MGERLLLHGAAAITIRSTRSLLFAAFAFSTVCREACAQHAGSFLCADGTFPALHYGDIINCDLGCPRGYHCESTVAKYGACCKDASTTLPPQIAFAVQRSPPRRNDYSHGDHAPPVLAPLPPPPPSSSTDRELQRRQASQPWICERVPFKERCFDGSRPTFTLRWGVRDGKCCTYPWGYCYGTPVSEEYSLRSKEACEEICLRGGGGGARGNGNPGQQPPTGFANGGSGGNTGGYVSPSGNSGVNSQGGVTTNGGAYSSPSAIRPTTSRPRLPVIGNGLPNGTPGGGNNGGYSGGGTPGGNDNNAGGRKSCDRQPYQFECVVAGGLTRRSQFTLRWYVRDGKCCSYPWGYCPGTLVSEETAIRTKEECERQCLGGGRQLTARATPSPHSAEHHPSTEDSSTSPFSSLSPPEDFPEPPLLTFADSGAEFVDVAPIRIINLNITR